MTSLKEYLVAKAELWKCRYLVVIKGMSWKEATRKVALDWARKRGKRYETADFQEALFPREGE